MSSKPMAAIATLALAGCASVIAVPVTPSEATYDTLDEAARGLGWRSERYGTQLVVYPPGQRDMELWTDPRSGALELSCNPGPRDECKRLFNELSSRAGLEVRVN